MKHLIAPSILSADLARLGDDVRAVLDAGADVIHFDVMDNHYVPNLTFGPAVLTALRKFGISAPVDVHLMVSPVDALIEGFAKAGATSITFHPEASLHVDRSLALIRSFGIKSGLALNPATSLSWLDYLWDKLDMVCLMSVNPGFGGQQFIPAVLDKIKELRRIAPEDFIIEVDGGVKVSNIREIAGAGANMFVAGSAIFGSDSYQDVISAMRQELAS
ncbi:ribulose-phosphate 3-epimerase [Succinimonas amylolytica]|uniref:ribulose-phosphate 3-epimerase n=1 Tax=Succinimonas amylolytica TaxID=83769 RepID=UPI00037B1C16|nr:ribulose-phosphate 3-epimerase [Succinimonas amylolytica]